MDEYTAEAFVNRDQPITVISFGSKDEGDSISSDVQSKADAGKLNAALERTKHGFRHKKSASTTGHSLQDRLFSKLLEQVIPTENDENADLVGDKPIVMHAKRPPFSLPLMTNNFRRFNARIGIVFLFQNRVERLFSWRKPTHTVSFLFVYSFVCLDPYLLVILPITAILLSVMVPAFLERHPPPPSTSTSSTTPYYSYQGPALAPARTIKPASETSKDFFRNMRDLQNVMADFANVHDAAISAFAPLTDFSNEGLSSTTFLLCTVMAALLFLTAHLLPWKFILLLGGNGAIISSHPNIQSFLQNLKLDSPAGETAQGEDEPKQKQTIEVFGLRIPSTPSATMALLESAADISLDSYPEEREVEIFELQHRSLEPYSSSQWDHFLFTPMPYDPLSPSRIAGDRPRGCRFFEDVQPPRGWAWKSKKWELDLDCREWVVERMITGVGFEVPGGPAQGNGASDEVGGWVWDLPPGAPSREEDQVATALGYGDLNESKTSLKRNHKSKDKGKGKAAPKDWEEDTTVGSQGMGEWRRRRWVRVVHRISVPAVEKDKTSDRDRDSLRHKA